LVLVSLFRHREKISGKPKIFRENEDVSGCISSCFRAGEICLIFTGKSYKISENSETSKISIFLNENKNFLGFKKAISNTILNTITLGGTIFVSNFFLEKSVFVQTSLIFSNYFFDAAIRDKTSMENYRNVEKSSDCRQTAFFFSISYSHHDDCLN
jgi:hypothetical protein